MIKDISNIYKLSDSELAKKEKRLWDDTAPELKQFAEELKSFIQKSDTPYVLGLDGGYGTGKTHFSTRFSKFLEKEKIKTIYFSAWENDYLEDPFIVFAEQINSVIRKSNASTKFIKQLSLGLAKSAKITAGVDIGIIKCGAEISGDKLVSTLFPKKVRQTLLKETKALLAKFISSLPYRKLVLVVDELDRCRPDYAVKTLETIKHFFDIDGLFVIIPIHRGRLELYINGFYGVNDTKVRTNLGTEHYLQKFLNTIINIPSLNYDNICQDKILNGDFKHNIVLEKDRFNSIEELKKWLAIYAQEAQLSYRETLEVIKRAKLFCNNYKEDIRCRLLANILCNRLIKEKELDKHIGFGNDYMYDGRQTYPVTHNKKHSLLTKNLHQTLFDSVTIPSPCYKLGQCLREIKSLPSSDGKNYLQYFDNLQTIYHAFDELCDTDYDRDYHYYRRQGEPENYKQLIETGLQTIREAENEVKEFQKITGSDNSDDDRLKDYEDKVANLTKLFNKK